MKGANWSATENRVIEPFARSANALARVMFRHTDSAEFTDQEIYWIESVEDIQPFRPTFRLDLDEVSLEDESHLTVDDLRLVIVLRDRALHHWRAIQEFPIRELPGVYAVAETELVGHAIGRNMEFALLIVPRYELPPNPGRAFRSQHVVASRSFQINLRREGTRFPVRVQDEKWFLERYYPANTVWTIDWKNRDPGFAPADALDIVINEKYSSALQSVLGSEADSVFGRQIAAEIFAEVVLMTLRDSQEWSSDPESLLGVVLSGLGVKAEAGFLRFREMSQNIEDAVPRFRAYAQERLGLGEAMGRKG